MKHAILMPQSLAILVFVALVALGGFFAPDLEATPGAGTLFGTDASFGNLIVIDPLTGAGTLIGFMGRQAVPALAADPTTGVLYAGGGGGVPDLYIVDPATGAATLVGDTGLGFGAAIGGMDFSADGTLYAAVNIAGDGGTGSDHLAIIDTTTGAATVIGPFGTCTGVTIPSSGGGSCTIDGIEAVAFDASGTLWGALRPSSRNAGALGLYTIDPATGAATFVAPILDASGAPPSGGVVSLQFACDGTLFGGTATRIAPGADGGRLITIDPATGFFSFVGSVSATAQGNSLGALAFQVPCPVVTSVTGSANRLGEAGAGNIGMSLKFTYLGAIDLSASTVTIHNLLNELGGAGELVSGLPITLDVRLGGRPNAAIFETPPQARPKLRLEVQTKGSGLFDSHLRVEFAKIAFPRLCPPSGRPPRTNLATSFTIIGIDSVASTVEVETTQAWRCTDFIRGTSNPRSLRVP